MIQLDENILDYDDKKLREFINLSFDETILIKNLPDDKPALGNFINRIGKHGNRPDLFWSDPEEITITRVTNKRVDGKKIGLFADLDLCWHCHGHTRNVDHENTLMLYCSDPGDNNYGITGWCNSRKAFYDLPKSIQEELVDVKVRMDALAFMGERPTLHKNDGGYLLKPEDPEYPIMTGKITKGYESTYSEVWKNLVYRHPVDGKYSLHFAPSFIVDWTYEGNSEEMWDYLYDHVFSDKYCYYHKWNSGDMIVSDQRSQLHNRSEVKGSRLLYRFCVDNSNMKVPYVENAS
tara:strand:- start:428 stop:1303 length:876 start_codon:yes stop_codon:yes gene_type:complete